MLLGAASPGGVRSPTADLTVGAISKPPVGGGKDGSTFQTIGLGAGIGLCAALEAALRGFGVDLSAVGLIDPGGATGRDDRGEQPDQRRAEGEPSRTP